MATSITPLETHRCFDGTVGVYRHDSVACASSMTFAVYQPPQAQLHPVPVLYFLSGLTCTEQNFITKSGVQRYAADHGVMIVAPDTSPRGTGIPDEDADWTYGSGASFYVNATQLPWKPHYQMYRYVVEELPTLIATHFPIQSDRQGIFGHSMGGHGALVVGLRNGDRFRSISAFAPICQPAQSDWASQAFNRYLGAERKDWLAYDATHLVSQYRDPRPILIDQGLADPYLAELRLDEFERACEAVGRPLTLRRHPDYDHGYYFIASFLEDHIRFHAEQLSR
jgi:S-formylglutathione hydrolase